MLSFKRICAMGLTTVMLFSLVGCNTKEPVKTKTSGVLKLDMWQVGAGYYKGKVQDNIVKKAITKATGVEISSLVYSGQMDDYEKFNLLYGANQLPAIMKIGTWGKGPQMIEKLEKQDAIWEFTEEDLEKYVPDIYKAIGKGAFNIAKRPNGKYAQILGGAGDISEYWKKKYPDWYKNYGPVNSNGNNVITIREDVLKEFFPNAKTYDQLNELNKKNGKLTYDEVKVDDVVVDWDSFVKFVYDVKAKYNTTPLLIGGNGQINGFARMFFQSAFWWNWDPITGKSNQIQVDKPEQFAKIIEDMNKMYNDGMIDKDYAIVKGEQIDERSLSGKYPLILTGKSPSEINPQMEKENKPKYRKITIAYEKGDAVFNGYAASSQDSAPYAFAISKKKVSKEDLPKVLAYLNYFATDEGLKMLTWGPKDSGLWEEKDGKRQWKDPEFVKVLSGENPTGKIKDFEYYGLFAADRKYYQDEFWAPMHEWSSALPYNPTIDNQPSLQDSMARAVAEHYVKGTYSDPYGFWNTQTKTNPDFWAGINEYQDALTKAVMSKNAGEVKTNMDKAQGILKTKMNLDAYRAEQSKFVDFIKQNKDIYKLHPEATFSK